MFVHAQIHEFISQICCWRIRLCSIHPKEDELYVDFPSLRLSIFVYISLSVTISLVVAANCGGLSFAPSGACIVGNTTHRMIFHDDNDINNYVNTSTLMKAHYAQACIQWQINARVLIYVMLCCCVATAFARHPVCTAVRANRFGWCYHEMDRVRQRGK